MKRAILIIFLISFTFSYANDSKNPNKPNIVKTNKEFTERSVTTVDLEALEFTADIVFKNVTFNAADKINFINIYDENNQQIFSAKGSIIVGDTLNISFLEKGTYYIEVVVGKTIGAKQIII